MMKQRKTLFHRFDLETINGNLEYHKHLQKIISTNKKALAEMEATLPELEAAVKGELTSKM